jgi:hypothetical protein
MAQDAIDITINKAITHCTSRLALRIRERIERS